MIELTGITKYFSVPAQRFFAPAQKITALNQVTLTISAGITAVLGPNGAGKTTLLKIIAGLLIPDTGTRAVKGSIGYVSGEAPGFYPQLTGRQNLNFFSTMYDILPAQSACAIKTYAQALGIENLDMPFWKYSTGTKHKLVLVRLLALNASIIIMDEPTKSLDPFSARAFRSLLADITKQSGKTVILATHSLQEAESISDTILIMRKGKIQHCMPAPPTPGSALEALYTKTITGEHDV